VAPEGTGTVILVSVQLVGVAAIPLNVMVLDRWLPPKFNPVTVTGKVMDPARTLKLVIS